MKKSKFTEAQIAFALQQAETGVSVEEVCRKMGIRQIWLERIFTLLRREGFKNSYNRVYRLYKLEGLNVRS